MTNSPGTPSPRSTLDDLRARARSLEADKADIDALLRAMKQPLTPGEDARTHVDTLHLIIGDPALGGMCGSTGHRVDASAIHALLALGEPYASELSASGQRILEQLPPPPRPPTGREVARQERAHAVKKSPESGESKVWSRLFGGSAIGWGLLELLTVPMALGFSMSSALGGGVPVFFLAASGLTLLAPGLRIYTRSNGPFSRAIYISLNAIMIPGLLLLGFFPWLVFFVPMLFKNNWQLNGDSTTFVTMMGLGALVRSIVTLRLMVRG